MEETKLNKENIVDDDFEIGLELEKSSRQMKFASKAIAILIILIYFVAGIDAYLRRSDINITNNKLQNVVDAMQEDKSIINGDNLIEYTTDGELFSHGKKTSDVIKDLDKETLMTYSEKLRKAYSAESDALERGYYDQALEYFGDPEIARAIMPFIAAGLMPNLLDELSSTWMKQQDTLRDCSNKMYYVDYHEKAHPDSSILDKYRFLLESCALKMDIATDDLYNLIYTTHVLVESQYLSGSRENPSTMYQILEFIDTSLPDGFVASEKMVQDLCVIYTTNLSW